MAMSDQESDGKCLDYCMQALQNLIRALNYEPDGWEIADAILSVQNVVSRYRMEMLYQEPGDDQYETPPLTEAAAATVRSRQTGGTRASKAFMKAVR